MLQAYIDAKRPLGCAICEKIAVEIQQLNLPNSSTLSLPRYDAAKFELVTDPFSQTQDLVGYWYSAQQQRIGQLQFHYDGSFYAEYDVLQPHPNNLQFFVEAISAWGKASLIKTEAKLLALPQ